MNKKPEIVPESLENKIDFNNPEGALKGLRNFRQSPDIENFYRFVQEHGLREEAKMIFEKIMTVIKQKKKKKLSSKVTQ